MDFSLSTEQTLLKDSVERFVEEQYALEQRRKIIAGEPGFSRANWARFAELGWLGMSLPEAFGGFDGTPVETMVVMEVFGRGLVVEPYLSSVVLAGTLLTRGGSEDQRRALLPALAEGELVLAVGYAERQSRYDLHDVSTTAAPADGGFVIDGHKIAVFHGAAADKIIVSVRSGGDRRAREGVTLVLVDRGADGLEVRDYATVDGLRAADLTFAGVRLGADAVVGEVGQGLDLLEAAVDHGTAAVCAEAVGIMSALTELTGEYLKSREQFGQPIGRFQVLQHRLVDMFMACEEARSMSYMATLKLDAEAAERRRACAAAKAFIGKAGRHVGQEAVQLHGGMGMTDELVVGHYFKRLTMIDTLFGNRAYQLERLADSA